MIILSSFIILINYLFIMYISVIRKLLCYHVHTILGNVTGMYEYHVILIY